MSDALFIVIGTMFIFIVMFLMILLFLYYRTKSMSKVIYQDSETTCKIFNAKIDNDTCRIGEKTFSTKGVKPRSVSTKFGWMPLFRFKYDIPHALPFDDDEKVEIDPEALTRLGEMKTLDKLLSGKKTNNKELLMILVAGVVIGAVVGIALVATGVISVVPPIPEAIPLPPLPTR